MPTTSTLAFTLVFTWKKLTVVYKIWIISTLCWCVLIFSIFTKGCLINAIKDFSNSAHLIFINLCHSANFPIISSRVKVQSVQLLLLLKSACFFLIIGLLLGTFVVRCSCAFLYCIQVASNVYRNVKIIFFQTRQKQLLKKMKGRLQNLSANHLIVSSQVSARMVLHK